MKIPPELAYTGPLTFGPPADEGWRASYRSCRYMRDMPDSDLRQRLRDIFRNFMTIDAQGKSAPLPVAHAAHGYWRIRFVHVLEEMVLRFGPFPNGIGIPHGSPSFFPDPSSQRAQAALRAVDKAALNGKAILTKYGKHEHLKQTLLTGRIRISPASSFADSKHNRAIQDNELESIHWMFEPTDEELLPYAQLPGFDATEPVGTVSLTRFTEDHYIYCMSWVFDPWIFDDFDYDACLVIDDPVAFRDRLMMKTRRALGSRGHGFSAVTYVDPITQIDRSVPIAFQKHARYRYQCEVRGAWLPEANSGPLQAIFVDIGRLDDIARLVRI